MEILGNQGVICSLDPELQREIQAGRRLAAARDSDQDHVGLAELAMRSAVIVRHREVDRLDALLVLLLVHRAVRAADRMARLHPQTRLERIDERLEEVEEERLGAAHDLPHILVDQGGKDDRLAVAAGRLRLDARQAFLGSLRAVDERQGDLVEVDAFELREQAVPEDLRGDAGAVGNEEHGAPLAHDDKILRQCA